MGSKLAARLFIVVMVFAVTACSGGESGSPPSSPPPPIIATNSISGTTIAGAAVTASGPASANATADVNGNYVLSNLAYGDYTVVPSLRGYQFAPVSTMVTVNAANSNVTGINFTGTVTRIPMLATGKLIYPCPSAICAMDLSTGVESVVWGGFNIQPTIIVPFRGPDQRIAYTGFNIDGISSLSLPTLVQTLAVSAGAILAPNCPSATMERSFDIGSMSVGDAALIPSPCSYPGEPNRTDIFAVLMDGSLRWLRVTDDASRKYSPVFGGRDPMTGYVSVLYFKVDTNDIWQQIINPAAPNNQPSLIGGPTLFANNAREGERVMSVNPDYTHVAFMKNVNGQSHIVVKPLAGGAEVDLGPGSDPYWALDGSNLILFSDNNVLWAVNPDGTEVREVPVPSNLWGSVKAVVFRPLGF